MAGKVANPKITYSPVLGVTFSVQLLNSKTYTGLPEGPVELSMWKYDIKYGGRTTFAGSEHTTRSKDYSDAALSLLKWYMDSEYVRDYDKGEIKGSRGDWLLAVVPRVARTWLEAKALHEIPDIMVVRGDGVMIPLLDPNVPEVTRPSDEPVVEMDYVDPEDERAITSMGMFSG